MQIIKADNYNIYVGENSLHRLKKYAQEYACIFLLMDENTKKHCLPLIRKLRLPAFYAVVIKSGEKNKNLKTCEKIWRELSLKQADRKSLLVNLGGGVVCDIGAFCAATYKRGIDFINIPTTLLSQVDASVGGKTGIDFMGYKNHIGTFSFPKAVFADYRFLKTLPKRQILSGVAEMIKHALIADRKYLREMFKLAGISKKTKRANVDLSAEILGKLIPRSIEIKNAIVKKDPYEKNLRKALNFGHTFGHAIESASLKTRNPLLHGEAIAMGMICEIAISTWKYRFSLWQFAEITTLLFILFTPIRLPASLPALIKIMQQDKKNTNSKINVTLLKSAGNVSVDNEVNDEMILRAFSTYKMVSRTWAR